MSIFEFLTKFLVIWHPRHPWVCICSDLKPLETDMGDSSNCAILIWILAKSGLDPDIIHKIIFYNYQWQWEWELLELHNILVLKRHKEKIMITGWRSKNENENLLNYLNNLTLEIHCHICNLHHIHKSHDHCMMWQHHKFLLNEEKYMRYHRTEDPSTRYILGQ